MSIDQVKSRFALITEDSIGLLDPQNEDSDFDPDKTVYDLQTRPIKKGTAVVVVEGCSNSNSSLILLDDQFYWVGTSSLDIRV